MGAGVGYGQGEGGGGGGRGGGVDEGEERRGVVEVGQSSGGIGKWKERGLWI